MKLSGTTNNDCKVLIFDEENFELEHIGNLTNGVFSISYLKSGTKSVITDDADGRTSGYGNVEVVDDTANEYQELSFVHGSLYTCGYNTYGQLGHNDRIARSTLTKVGNEVNWTNVSCASSHFIGIQSNGTIWGCGANTSGQLGLNNRINMSTPTRIGTSNMWRDVFTKVSFSLFLHDDYSLWGCGINSNGQLGLNNRLNRSTPTLIGTDTDWRKVSCGNFHVVGIKQDGTMWSWGAGDNGRLGLGDIAPRSTPTRIGSDNDWKSIKCSTHGNFATKEDGSLWVWGQNSWYDLGLGDTVSRSTPTKVGNRTDWISYDIGLFVGGDGELWAYGDFSENGHLGFPSTGTVSTPTRVIGAKVGWKRIIAGSSYLSIGLRQNNTLWSFGQNTRGELGHGDLIARSTPTQIGSFSNWYTASAGYQHFAAIRTES